MHWNINNIIMTTIKYLEINQISPLNNQSEMDLLLNEANQTYNYRSIRIRIISAFTFWKSNVLISYLPLV